MILFIWKLLLLETIPSGQQFRLLLQEPTVAERGGTQEEGDDEADDGEEERDAEDDADVDTCQDCWCGGQKDKYGIKPILAVNKLPVVEGHFFLLSPRYNRDGSIYFI